MINADPILGENDINWHDWNYFIHNSMFTPQEDFFYADRLLLVGVLLCEATDTERI